MSILLDRCGWCIHIRENIDGWKPACDAFPQGIDFDVCDIPGRDCGNVVRFEVKPEKKERYISCWGDRWSKGPFNIDQSYDRFVNSNNQKKLLIGGNQYYRIIDKMKRYYDSGPKVVLLLQLDTFYAPGISQLTELVDEFNNRICIPDGKGYAPQSGTRTPNWCGFSCLVEPINIENENQIGNYIRVLRDEELTQSSKSETL